MAQTKQKLSCSKRHVCCVGRQTSNTSVLGGDGCIRHNGTGQTTDYNGLSALCKRWDAKRETDCWAAMDWHSTGGVRHRGHAPITQAGCGTEVGMVAA